MKLEELGLPEEVARGSLDAGSPRGSVCWTPLQYACAIGDLELVTQILESLADWHGCGKTKYDYSPLHIAVRYGHDAIVDALLTDAQVGTTPPAVDKVIGATALHVAVVQGNLPLVQTLVDCSNGSAVPTTNGTTPYELAKRLGFVEISQILLSHERQIQSRAQLRNWLASIGMIEYAPQFQAAGFEDAMFLLSNGLEDATLDAMHIQKPGHRMKLKSLYQLREFLEIDVDDGDDGDDDEEDKESSRRSGSDDDSEEALEDDNSDDSDDDDDEQGSDDPSED